MNRSAYTSKIQNWSGLELFAFRVLFIFFLLLTIPLDPAYYEKIFSLRLFHLHFQDLFLLTNYVPRLVHVSDWGIRSYTGWGLALLTGLAGASLWTLIEKGKRREYNELNYWLRVLLRYRLALGLIGYGIIKLFPLLLPYPTLSDLHTAYGDFLPWKIYYLSTGVSSAFYEQTLGAIEMIAGLLLLNRRTTAVGAGIAAALLINIVLANFAYQLGEHIYSLYLLLITGYLLAYDTPRLYDLLVKERRAAADHFEPAFVKRSTFKLRYGLKILFLVFVLGYGSLTYASYSKSRWPYPDAPGLTNAYGVYNVREYRVGDSLLPYSITDTTRWQDVVFEKWNVLSVKVAKHLPIDFSSPEIIYEADGQRDYESKGNGGRAFYTYSVRGNHIELTNKNNASDVETFVFSRPDAKTIILEGIDNHNDSVHIILDKLDKEYLLNKGRRKPVSVY